MTRLAVAIWPPSDVLAVLSGLDRPEVPDVRWSEPAQWMVKIRPLGHVDGSLVAPLMEALVDALDGGPIVRCDLGPATRRLGDELGAPVAGLDALAEVVFEATEPVVPVTHPQPFSAYVVLARGRVRADLAGQPVRASWTASVISLVADRSSPRAARFDDLATVDLGPE